MPATMDHKVDSETRACMCTCATYMCLYMPTCTCMDPCKCIYMRKSAGFPGSLAGKELACNAGDPSLIPGLGRFPGKEIGHPYQYSWASLVTQTVKNLPAMWKIWVRSLGWEDPLEEGMATHSSILAWRIPMDRGAWKATVHVVAKSQT